MASILQPKEGRTWLRYVGDLEMEVCPRHFSYSGLTVEQNAELDLDEAKRMVCWDDLGSIPNLFFLSSLVNFLEMESCSR